ncbi:MAG: hypothetical protein ABH823_01640 [bacterium]
MSLTNTILQGIVKSDRVAGAYLFLGSAGVGKKEAALYFSELLKCSKQDQVLIEPQGATVKIDQVRELQRWVRFGPSAGRYLVAIVDQADKLTDQAAGAFLKTLEEPAPGVVFVLLVEREDKLPATILSRCQKIIFSDQLAAWQARPELQPFYLDLRDIKNKPTGELLGLSARLAKEKETIEDILYNLAYYCQQKLKAFKLARIILDTVRYLKRRANLKLALDVMCLKLGANHV